MPHRVNINWQYIVELNCGDLQDILANEWMTIDDAVHRIDISAKLEEEINDHIYLKFPVLLFECNSTGTISLPVSDALLVLGTVFEKDIKPNVSRRN